MKRTPLIIAAVVVIGVGVGGIATGSFFVGGLLLLGLAVLFLVPSALIARRARATAESDYSVRSWPLWSFPAVGIALVYLAFGIGQLISDPKKENVFALGIMSLMSAMIFRGLALRRSGALRAIG